MQWLETLNTEQREAATAGNGPVVIVAGPGTGKTKTLTARIAHLVTSGRAKPEQILALTFTKKAAEEMRRRVTELLGATAKPRISTFHALCHELLGANRETPVTFVGEPERLQIIKSLSRPAALKHLSVREVGLLISKAKNAIESEDVALQKLVSAYNTALREQNLHDFDDLLGQTRELLEANEPIRKAVQKTYTHVLVDEFQDTNRLQYELLHLLRGNDHLFVIGDPNQSIYGFRGASGDTFQRFTNEFPKAQQVTLHVNYRSAPEVVRLSNTVFPATTLQAHATTPGHVQALHVLNEYSEASWVLGEIQRTIGGGDFLHAVSDDDHGRHRTLKDFAILYRSRSAAIAMQRAFAESGLPYQIVGDGSPYDKPDVQAVIALLGALESGEDIEIKGLSKSQCRALLDEVDPQESPSQIVVAIIKRFGFEQSPELLQLANSLVRFDTLQVATNHLRDIAEQQFYDPEADAVTLLTIHAAKGLEFPHVFLVSAEEGILPHAKADPDEERRLFYVAVTRAKERLDILHTHKRGGKPVKPSRFITEIDDKTLPKNDDINFAADQRRAAKRQLKRSQQSLF